MKKDKDSSDKVATISARRQASPASAEEAHVWKVLDEARQRVKPAVKKEVQGEKISPDLFNFRLRGGTGGGRASRT